MCVCVRERGRGRGERERENYFVLCNKRKLRPIKQYITVTFDRK